MERVIIFLSQHVLCDAKSRRPSKKNLDLMAVGFFGAWQLGRLTRINYFNYLFILNCILYMFSISAGSLAHSDTIGVPRQ